MRYLVPGVAIAGAALMGGPVEAQSLDDLRRQLQSDLRNSDIGAGYAQMLNFFIDPSISASLLKADDGTDYDVFKVPLQTALSLNDRGWQLAIRGTLSHAEAKNPFQLFDGETIDGTWEAYSGQVGAGLIIPVTDTLSWYIAGQFGISQLESTADYGGSFSEAIIAPIADGILFNWDTNARIYSLGAGMDYADTLAERYDVGVYARYTHSYIESYSESRDLVPFSADTGTFSTKADLMHPYGVRLVDRPLFGVVHAGVTAFTGPNRNALGFSHFYELGYSVGVDVSEGNRFFKSFSLGYQLILGSDLDGYSLLLGWELK